MPIFAVGFLYIEVAALMLAALVSPTYESGSWSILAPFLNVLAIGLCIAFQLKMKHSDTLLLTYCVVGLTFGVIYFSYQLMSQSIGLSISDTLMLVETAALAGLYVTIRSQSVVDWFQSKGQGPKVLS